jgi:hypothetical protein
MEITKDKKGPCWIISHKRSGYHEEITVTDEELAELYTTLTEML